RCCHRTTISSSFPYTTLFRSCQRNLPILVRSHSDRTAARCAGVIGAERVTRQPHADGRASRLQTQVAQVRAEHRIGNLVAAHPRSEEHTSELQSRENLVCRLL